MDMEDDHGTVLLIWEWVRLQKGLGFVYGHSRQISFRWDWWDRTLTRFPGTRISFTCTLLLHSFLYLAWAGWEI